MHSIGVHFDAQAGIIPNDGKGRIITQTENKISTLPGMYCSGWVKRGPTGVIASTMEDAFSTAEAIAQDWEAKAAFLMGGDGWETLRSEVSGEGGRGRTVSWEDWLRIDAVERREGAVRGKEREKLTSVEGMLGVLD